MVTTDIPRPNQSPIGWLVRNTFSSSPGDKHFSAIDIGGNPLARPTLPTYSIWFGLVLVRPAAPKAAILTNRNRSLIGQKPCRKERNVPTDRPTGSPYTPNKVSPSIQLEETYVYTCRPAVNAPRRRWLVHPADATSMPHKIDSGMTGWERQWRRREKRQVNCSARKEFRSI